MNFDFTSAVKAKETSARLEPGIKKATFEGVEFKTITSQQTGDIYKTLSLKLNIEGFGLWSRNFFEPNTDERSQSQFGLNASQLDHFLISVRQILEAVSPNIVNDMNEGKVVLKGSFKAIVDKVKELTDPFIGKEVEIKLLPQRNGYCDMPSFPAKITKTGDLAIATRIIGHNLTFSAKEATDIEKFKNAKPTDMSKNPETKDLLDDMSKSLDVDGDSDLPF